MIRDGIDIWNRDVVGPVRKAEDFLIDGLQQAIKLEQYLLNLVLPNSFELPIFNPKSLVPIPLDNVRISDLLEIPTTRLGAAMVAGTYGATQIGQAYKGAGISAFEQKLCHGTLGAVTGYILDGSLEGAAAGAIGAVAGEIIAEHYKEYHETQHLKEGGDPGDLLNAQSQAYQEMVEKGVAVAKMTAATTATLLGQDPNIAAQTAANAARHNAFFVPLIIGGMAIYTAKEIWDVYKKDGPVAALQRAGFEAVIAVAGGAAVKAGIKAGAKFYQFGGRYIPLHKAEAAWAAYAADSPAIQLVIKTVEKGGQFLKKADDAASKAVGEFAQNATDRVRKIFGSEVSPKIVSDAALSPSNTAVQSVKQGATRGPPTGNTAEKVLESSSKASSAPLTEAEKKLAALEKRMLHIVDPATPLRQSEKILLSQRAKLLAQIEKETAQKARTLKAQEKRQAADLKTLEHHEKSLVKLEKLPEGYAYRRVSGGDYLIVRTPGNRHLPQMRLEGGKPTLVSDIPKPGMGKNCWGGLKILEDGHGKCHK